MNLDNLFGPSSPPGFLSSDHLVSTVHLDFDCVHTSIISLMRKRKYSCFACSKKIVPMSKHDEIQCYQKHVKEFLYFSENRVDLEV